MPPQDDPSAYHLRPGRQRPCLSHGLFLRQAPMKVGSGEKEVEVRSGGGLDCYLSRPNPRMVHGGGRFGLVALLLQ